METVKAWESGAVAAGAVITSPVVDAGRLSELVVLVDNSDAAAADRNVVVEYLARDAATVLYSATVACVKGARYLLALRATQPVPAAPPTGASILPLPLAGKLRVTLAAGGAKAAQVALYGRR